MKDLAYVPLDLPRIDIDYDEISEFFEEHKHNQYPFEETWEGIYLIGDVKDWDDPVSTRESFLIKYETDNARWNPKIPEHLLILFKQIIHQLNIHLLLLIHIVFSKLKHFCTNFKWVLIHFATFAIASPIALAKSVVDFAASLVNSV